MWYESRKGTADIHLWHLGMEARATSMVICIVETVKEFSAP